MRTGLHISYEEKRRVMEHGDVGDVMAAIKEGNVGRTGQVLLKGRTGKQRKTQASKEVHTCFLLLGIVRLLSKSPWHRCEI
ncbi:hypothetical protein CEXT_165921 [Caerostris extrusa]|uniref:Uncharacterized protein n=1 Tax=Caerostris extrusa TaxID=172846 RepID=A0AAV4UY65_CAEEX|nr:hypothetical protein CEXT_165921 [Caerostris extrusa]